ncbi:hypothetical protein [Paenibacillus periandrae]|uniref:hypothetical protein n=1 Tax=Paenibacillus periandrae TaxID=1761741 RepID=UPI001F097C55|nr:hypothetical protein [Paenibacillus periandrae]
MTNEQQALQALTHLTGHDKEHFCMNEDHGSAGIIYREKEGTVYFVVTDAQFAAYEPGEVSKVKVLGSHLGLTAFSELEEGISDDGTVGTTDVRPEDLAMAFKADGSIIIVDANTDSGDKAIEIVQTIGHLTVIRVYANAIQDNGTSYYGDIFTSKPDLLKKHPDCVVLGGFCVHDRLTGYSPDDSEDWYTTIEEAVAYINTQPQQKTLPLIVVLDEHGYCRLLGSIKCESYDVFVDKVKTTDKAVARDIFRQRGHDIPEPPAPTGTQEKMTDQEVESLWVILTDVPFDEDAGFKELHLAHDWYIFKKGTEREEIWHWFDKNHSKGVAWLLYDHDADATIEELVKSYLLSRNPLADIVKAWLGYDEFGYKTLYKNSVNEENGSYLTTHVLGEAIREMNLTLGRNFDPTQESLPITAKTKWVCPAGCEIDTVLVCGGDLGREGKPNIYFQMTTKGSYTNLYQDGSAGVPVECHEHADGGCCTEPQCPDCLKYCEQVIT